MRRFSTALRRLFRPFFRPLVEEIIDELGRRTVDGKPNINRFSARFQDAELTTRNVNRIVWQLPRQLYPGLAH